MKAVKVTLKVPGSLKSTDGFCSKDLEVSAPSNAQDSLEGSPSTVKLVKSMDSPAVMVSALMLKSATTVGKSLHSSHDQMVSMKRHRIRIGCFMLIVYKFSRYEYLNTHFKNNDSSNISYMVLIPEISVR